MTEIAGHDDKGKPLTKEEVEERTKKKLEADAEKSEKVKQQLKKENEEAEKAAETRAKTDKEFEEAQKKKAEAEAGQAPANQHARHAPPKRAQE